VLHAKASDDSGRGEEIGEGSQIVEPMPSGAHVF
jgi:hypothetical protein